MVNRYSNAIQNAGGGFFGDNTVGSNQGTYTGLNDVSFERGLDSARLTPTIGGGGYQADNGYFSQGNIGGTLQGLAGIGQFGLGVANYFQNKSNFKDMMKLQLANFDEQKKAAAYNASVAADSRARRMALGGRGLVGTSDRTKKLESAITG